MDMPVAGWYADPYGEAPLRWWDGAGWTETVSPIDVAPGGQPPPAAGTAPAGDGSADGGGNGGDSKPATKGGLLFSALPLLITAAAAVLVLSVGWVGVKAFAHPTDPAGAANKFFLHTESGDYAGARDSLCAQLRDTTTTTDLENRLTQTVGTPLGHTVKTKTSGKQDATVVVTITDTSKVKHNLVVDVVKGSGSGWQVCSLP